MRRWRRFGMVVLAALGSVGPGLEALAAEAEEHVVVLEHGRFQPAEVEVAVGEKIVWRHQDGDDPQSVTADDGTFDSHPNCSEGSPQSCMRGGDEFEWTPEAPGRFPYHSRTEDTSGVVTVVEEHDHG